jgi:hypothetical protein
VGYANKLDGGCIERIERLTGVLPNGQADILIQLLAELTNALRSQTVTFYFETISEISVK